MFVWILKKLFKFNPGLDQEFVLKEKAKGVNKVYILKRSILYAITLSKIGIFLGLMIIFGLKVYTLAFNNAINDIVKLFLFGIDLFCLVFTLVYGIKYFIFYNKSYTYEYMDSDKLIAILKKGDALFVKVFNQIFVNYIFYFIGLCAFAYYGFQGYKFDSFYNVLDFVFTIVYYIIVIVLYNKLGEVFINLEMDYTLVSIDKLIFVNQTGTVNDDVVQIQMNKIKKVKVSGDGIQRKFFGYGEIDIYLEGSTAINPDLKLAYIKNSEYVREIIEEMRERFFEKATKLSSSENKEEVQKEIENKIHTLDQQEKEMLKNF